MPYRDETSLTPVPAISAARTLQLAALRAALRNPLCPDIESADVSWGSNVLQTADRTKVVPR